MEALRAMGDNGRGGPMAEVDPLLSELAGMPDFLDRRAKSFGANLRWKPAEDRFSFLENVWHLADLERDGYGVRIARLLRETSPSLADFDGERVARERRYAELDLADGLRAFRRAREDNLAALRRLTDADRRRAGTQDGVGAIALSDVPRMMRSHDLSHRAEIEELVSGIARGERSKA